MYIQHRFAQGYHNLAPSVSIRIIVNHSMVSSLKSLTVHVHTVNIVLLNLNRNDMHIQTTNARRHSSLSFVSQLTNLLHNHDTGQDNEITGAISALDQGAEVDCGLVEEPVNLQTPLRAACAKVHRGV